jgi:cobalt-zinc-cadmium efflux system membrane fusion protein
MRSAQHPLARWVAVAIGCFLLGVLGATLVLRHTPGSSVPTVAAPTKEPLAPASARPTTTTSGPADVEVLLTPDAVVRAGIKTATVGTAESTASIQVPGSVTANAYREVKVTPVASGIVTRVHVELGATVRRGAPLATLFSAELAEAQMKYLSMSAAFEADHKKLERTEQLVVIGAASRQELEEVTAMHAAHETEVGAARQRLLLLGLTPERVAGLKAGEIVSDIVVPAPIDGVMTGRSVNLGQVVGPGQELFTVTDLSQVWVVGDLYEQNFRAVRVGSEAAVTTQAYPGLVLRGRVSYIDPRMDLQTRTAKVRVEVPNREGRLRLGMYTTMEFTTRGDERRVLVPRVAVQTLGGRQVVFLPSRDEEGKFIQRSIRIGELAGDSYTVLDGLKSGDVVVTEGSFFLRAESMRNAPSE